MVHTRGAAGGVLRALAASALAAVVACGGARAPASGAGAGAPDRQLSEEIAGLRVRLAEDPRDADLHRALGHALLRADRPGGAIRHLTEARRRGALTGADRRALARLLLARAEARLAAGDGEAWRDLDEAAGLDPTAARRPALARDLLFAGARADLRRSDRPGRERGRRLLARAARLAPADPRLALLNPRRADLVALGIAAAWLDDGGARRAALEAYRIYLQRGGRATDHLRRALALHRWWSGDRRRPTGLVLDDARRAGLDLCGLAGAPDELGCGAATARAAADPTGEAAAAIARRARRLGWRVDDPAAVGPWMALSIGAWLRGEVDGWTAALASRLDLAALVAPGARARVPSHLLATVLRAAGSGEAAAAAFDRAVEHAAALAPADRALLLAEALAQGRGEGTIDRLLHAGEASPLAWRLALRAANLAEPAGAREASLVERGPAPVVLAHLRETGALGALLARRPTPAVAAALVRWRAALDGTPLAAGREAVEAGWRRLSSGAASPSASPLAGSSPGAPLGVIDPHRLTSDPQLARELGRIARAWRRDPAAADRLAADLLDRSHAALEPGLAVAELFARLDDPARAWRWIEPLTRHSPHEPRALMAAGAVSAAAGAVSRAEIFFLRGAAASGDPGEASLAAARAYLVTGHPLAAVSAARRAVQHSAPGQPEQDEALALAALGLEELGRHGEAGALRAGLPAALAPAEGGAAGAAGAPSDTARLAALDPAEPAWAEAAARELARALIGPPDRAAPALDRLAAALDRAGHAALAHAVRRERRAVTPLAPLSP